MNVTRYIMNKQLKTTIAVAIMIVISWVIVWIVVGILKFALSLIGF